MNKSEFALLCEKALSFASGIENEKDAEKKLRAASDNIKIVTVERRKNRTRAAIACFVAFVSCVAVLTIGLLYGDFSGKVFSTLVFVSLFSFSVVVGISNINPVTHRAVCVKENGKVREFVFERDGGFIYNTIEGEIVFRRGKIYESKHDHTHYEPSFPYVDFFDKDFSAFCKSRGGEGYDPQLTCRFSVKTECVVAENSEKTEKFSVFFEGGTLKRMDYRGTESYHYLKLNDSAQTVYMPCALKSKIKIPEFLNVEYTDEKDFATVWEKLNRK